MDIDAYRRARLKELVDKEAGGNVAAFARAHPLAVDATRLRQMLNPNYRGGAGFKEGAARKLEKSLGLPNLYFDFGIESAIARHTSDISNAPISAPKVGLSKDFPTDSKHSINGDGPKQSIENVTPTAMGRREIPVISYVQAGMMTEAIDPYALGDGFETVVTEWDVSESTFALRIKGKSMLPMFEEGDTVIIDPTLQPRPGDFVVAKNTEEEATFKKYRPRGTSESGEMIFELVPLNDDFATLNSERDHLRIIGVMIEHRRHYHRR